MPKPADAAESQLGRDELERNMRPGRAADAARIGLIAAAMLLAINSGGLVKWTQELPSTATNAWIAERAADWHHLMMRLGPAAVFERLRKSIRPE